MLNIKNRFPWFQNNPEYVYMDSGATSLKPQMMIDEIVNYYTSWSTNPHNTDSKITHQVHDMVESTRAALAQLVHCQPDEIVFNSGATEALNLIANGIMDLLEEGDEIVLTYGEHASNILPWMHIAEIKNLKIKYAGEKFRMVTPEDYLNVLTPKTKVVAFASGYNLTGNSLDETAITKIVKEYNPEIMVVVDATQSIQHREINIEKSGFDFMACSAHKMFGPTGVGAAYIKKSLQPKVKPLRYGGGMNFSIETQSYELLEGVMKYEGGTQNVAGILGWKKAIEFLQELGYEAIHEHEVELARYAREKLSQIKNIIIYNEGNDSPTIAFNYEGVFCQDLASYLGRRKIIVRSGLSCAKLYCNLIDTKALVRCSLYIYNTKEDVDKLFDVLNNFTKGDELYELF
ncbi:aminotransferase class V-fold PLP-dependent enzyme [Ureaplasma ceti]|uniref:Aminotransferase class V-fold PLP-dependent enzyme n=1 Tax=Ureaplasma ceti TaxID=3119530 RepID=A0ABP9U5Q7_9BACT